MAKLTQHANFGSKPLLQAQYKTTELNSFFLNEMLGTYLLLVELFCY